MSMKWMILATVLLAALVHADNPDYCAINSEACISYWFELDDYTEGDEFTCVIQPLEFNEETLNLATTNEAEQTIPATKKWVETLQVCALPEPMMFANVTLVSALNGPVETVLIYPMMCFSCDSSTLSCTETTTWNDFGTFLGGCYIDSFCYPIYALNPANPAQMCYEKQWTDIDSIDLDGRFAVPVDTCEVLAVREGGYTNANADRSTTPEIVGGEGIDLTDSREYHYINSSYMSPIATHFKLLVKFKPESPEQYEHVMFLYNNFVMTRTAEDTLTGEFYMLDADFNEVTKTLTLMDNVTLMNTWSIGKGYDGWHLIGMSYDIRSGTPTSQVYVNGKKFGPITGLTLRMNIMMMLSKAEFSCLEFNSEADESFFTSPTFDKCKELPVRSDDELNACEAAMTIAR